MVLGMFLPFERLAAPGAQGAIMLVSGAIGALLGLGAAVLNRRRIGFVLGVAALVSSMVVSGLGIAAVMVARQHVDAEVRSMPSETSQQKARREGYEAAKRAVRASVAVGAPALMGGLAGVLPPFLRRRRPRPESMRMPRSLRSHTRQELGSKTGAASVAAVLLAVGGYLVAAFALAVPPPGPSLPSGSPAWDAREAIDAMRAGRTRYGCEALERACAKECVEASVPDLRSAVTECFELRLAEAEEGPDPRASLRALSETALPLSDSERQRLRAELAR